MGVVMSDGQWESVQLSIIGHDLFYKGVKSNLLCSIKGLPKEAVCPKASQKSVSLWDMLWLGLPAKKGMSHAKTSAQFAAGTCGFHRDAIKLSKSMVSTLLSGL